MLSKIFAGLMVISGLLTLTMLYVAVAPEAALQSMIGEAPSEAIASVVVRSWGILVGMIGLLLIYGAFHPPSRKLALVFVGASKISWIALVLMHGDRYWGTLGISMILDSVMVVLFAIYIILGKATAA